MAVQFFAPKTLGSVTLGAGALTGGGAIYWYQVPRTWKELLVKEGFLFLNSEHDYKGMFNDQKDTQDWKGENDLNKAKEEDVKDKATTYCNTELEKPLPSSYEESYSKTKKKLISFCTTDGIQTVKARLMQSQKKGWIEDAQKDKDDKWKAVFAVYRYEPRFIEWLKEDSNDSQLSSTSKVSDNWEKIKNACTNLLKKNYKDVSDDHIKYGSWWCVELGYDTIKKKIKKTDPSWEEKPQNASDWNQLKNKWKDTEKVKKWASSTKDSEEELTVDNLKTLCGDTNLNAQLSAEDSYQEKYIVIKSVCKKES